MNTFLPLEKQTPISEKEIVQLTSDIKKKKELAGLADSFVREQLSFYLQKNLKAAILLVHNFHPKSAIYKQVIKDIRSQLRRVYGLFREAEDLKRRKEFLQVLKSAPAQEKNGVLQTLLATSSSTKERLPWYEQWYGQLFKMTGKPKVILDIGAGIHPFSLFFVVGKKWKKKLKYFAYDLSNEETSLLRDFFDFLHKNNLYFSGLATVLDAHRFEELKKQPKADIALLLKVTDVLDIGKKHRVSEYVISAVPARFVVVSFPTITMSGKEMNFPERKWIELMCVRLGYGFEKFRMGNEIFYVIKKK